MLKKYLITLSILVTPSIAVADILGDFSSSKMLPGYIDFSPTSLVQFDLHKQKKNNDDLENRSPSEILKDYFRKGSFDTSQFESLLQKIELKENSEFIGFCLSKDYGSQEDCKGENIDEKILKKWHKYKYYLAYNELKKLIKETITLSLDINPSNLNKSESVPFLDKFFTTLELWEALKRPDREYSKPSALGRIVKLNVHNFLLLGKYFSIERGVPEAANLLVPGDLKNKFPDQMFFSPEQLIELEKQGIDISRLDPQNSDFWSAPTASIGKYDLTNYNGDTKKSLKDIFPNEFVEDFLDDKKILDIEYIFDETQGGTTPKFVGKVNGVDFKVKYITDRITPNPTSLNPMNFFNGLTNQSEPYTEKVANNIAAALGFPVDPTYFKKKVRVFFRDKDLKDKSFEENKERLLKEVREFNQEHANAETAFKVLKTDEKTGRKYFELHNVSLEKKNDDKTDINLSFFIRHGMGKHLKREHRGMAFLLALIQDIDARDQNDKIKLIPYTDGEGTKRYRPVGVITDMGASLGMGNPNLLPKEFVKSVSKDRKGIRRIKLKYMRLFPTEILKSVSIADAKWIMRLFGQLSSEQVYKSFETSGYPSLIAELMTRKLMDRRNQIMEALDLIGEKITDVEGNEVILKKEWEFSGSIKGYEEFFKDGYLNDPEEKLFPDDKSPFRRSWTASLNPKIGESKERKGFKHLGQLIMGVGNSGAAGITKKLSYDITSVLKNFKPIQDLDDNINSICTGGGHCFAHGLSVGPMGLIPFTFVIENPDKSSSKPFLIVNMFRIGVKVSSKTASSTLATITPIPLPSPKPELVGSVLAIKEFITVTGTDSLLDYSRKYKKAIKTAALLSPKRLKSFVRGMEEGQTLIMSSYFAGSLHGYFTFTSSGIGLGVGAGATLSLANRVILNKSSEQEMLAHWSKLSKKELEALLQFKAFFGINIAGLGLSQTKINDRTFKFNPTVSEDMDTIMENLQTIRPSISEKYRLQERDLKYSTANANAGLLFFLKAQAKRDKGEITLKDFVTGEEKEEDFKILNISKSKTIGANTVNYESVYKASINKDSNVFINVTSDFSSSNLTRDKLIEVVDKMDGYIPENFIPYDLNALGHYLGQTKLQTKTIISDEGLTEFFNTDENEICKTYTELNDFSVEICEESRRPLPLKAFMKDFEQAKSRFFELKNGNLKHFKRLTNLKHIMDIFARFTKQRSALHLIKKTISFENYFTEASLESGNLIGNAEIITLDKDKRGGFTPSLRHKLINPSEQFELFSDDLTNALGGIFFKSI